MDFRLEFVNEQMCQLYFSISSKEMKEMLEDAIKAQSNQKDSKNSNKNFDNAVEKVKSLIEDDIIENKIDEYEIEVIGTKSTRYLMNFEIGRPMMGIVEMCILPDNLNFSLPTFIPDIFYESKIEKDNVKSFIDKLFLANNLFKYEDANQVSLDSIITYDLRFEKDNVVINEIKDQKFDCMNDDDLDLDLIEGKKVGSEVYIDVDDVYTILKITSIKDRVPIEENNENVAKLKFGSIKSYDSLFKKIESVLEFQKNVDVAMIFILEGIIASNQIEISDEVIRFFAKKLHEDDINDKDILKEIKRIVIFEYLVRVVELKTDDGDLSNETQKKINDMSKMLFLADGRKSNIMSRQFIIEETKRAKILEYCRDNDYISNIKL